MQVVACYNYVTIAGYGDAVRFVVVASCPCIPNSIARDYTFTANVILAALRESRKDDPAPRGVRYDVCR